MHLITLCSDASVLVSGIKSTSHIAGSVLSDKTSSGNHVAIRKQHLSLEKDNHAKIALVGRTFAHLVEGFRRLDHVQEVEQKSQIIYHFAKIFSTTISQIGKLSVNVSVKQDSVSQKPYKGRGRRRKNTPAPQHPSELYGIRLELCKLFVQMLSLVQLEADWRREVVDGAMYSLLSRAGTILKAFVFEDQNDDQVPSDIEPSPINDQNTLLEEAPFMVWILERAMAIVQRSSANADMETIQKSQIGGHRAFETPHLEISDIARSRLQNTLMKAVFQDDERNFEDRLFEPTSPGFDFGSTLPTIGRDNIANWFKSEIWRLVGWDILRKSIEVDSEEDNI